MRNAIRNLAWVVVGAGVAWAAMRLWREQDAVGPPRASESLASAADDRPVTSGAGRSEPVTSNIAPATLPGPQAEATGDSPQPRVATSAPNPTVVWNPPKDLPITPTDIPNRRRDDSAGRTPATDLLDQSRITCDFGPGINSGMRFGDTLTMGAGAQWQGSLMVYDLLEPAAGKARLTGTVGSTGSPSGETKVQLMLYETRIYFLGLQGNGTYVITTIYDELDDMGRHVAVMSRHENGFFAYGTQWLGVCY
jgi:hypothetical protein